MLSSYLVHPNILGIQCIYSFTGSISAFRARTYKRVYRLKQIGEKIKSLLEDLRSLSPNKTPILIFSPNLVYRMAGNAPYFLIDCDEGVR